MLNLNEHRLQVKINILLGKSNLKPLSFSQTICYFRNLRTKFKKKFVRLINTFYNLKLLPVKTNTTRVFWTRSRLVQMHASFIFLLFFVRKEWNMNIRYHASCRPADNVYRSV